MSRSEHFAEIDRKKALAGDVHAAGSQDRRALRTRRALHEALIGLVVARNYDELTVGEIADAANVGRSTFYAHYTSKDDLLRDGVSSLKALLLSGLDEGASGSKEPLAFSVVMTTHFGEQLDLYRGLMRGSAGPVVLKELRRVVGEVVRQELARTLGGRSSEPVVQMVAGGYISLVTWWLDRGAKEPARDIERAFRDYATAGLKSLRAERTR